jgi:hypothetical protein
MLIYYVEMKDTSNLDEWSNKVDLYGYENKVLVMAMGYSKTIDTDCKSTTVDCINDIVTKLESKDFVVINKEEKQKNDTKTVGGYTILECCIDCEEEIEPDE